MSLGCWLGNFLKTFVLGKFVQKLLGSIGVEIVNTSKRRTGGFCELFEDLRHLENKVFDVNEHERRRTFVASWCRKGFLTTGWG